MPTKFTVYELKCPNCNQTQEFKHLHDAAHGIPETHMAGSERFSCVGCLWSVHAGDIFAIEHKLPFFFDDGSPPASTLFIESLVPKPPSGGGISASLAAALEFALEPPDAL